MKPASIKQIKEALSGLTSEELQSIIQRLARFKAENKELLTYLLFEQQDEESYVDLINADMEVMFDELNMQTAYILKKQLRKIVRFVTRSIRYSDVKETEVSIRIAFCINMRKMKFDFRKHTLINNIYQSQLKLANKVVATLHEDLQYDYLRQLKSL